MPQRNLLRCAFSSTQHTMENAFNERGVMITRNGLSAAGQVFALRDIRQVDVVKIPKNRLVPSLISLIGAAAAVAGGIAGSSAVLVVGVMLAVVGYLAWATQDVTYRLMVDMPDGKREALSSVDVEFVERVAQVVREAQAAKSAG
ncbi:hypothetical protein Bcep18194_B0223 [Burkholderia lata]|uniref:Uncharacterized protein n=2 Tax=Burkholderia lata (strain ATCC 17760 / DSM 23089 / LMG 22485 / NCIMB 9086 / R18194 / 383) TaxID=482957 RepID=Q39B22_BURL3|nr:hypothetical protein Bcep18194_B0223 [Burkholderia lata]